MRPHILAIDLGTGGPKVALVDGAGQVSAWRERPITTANLADGGAEQDPHEMWSAVVSATREVVAAAPLETQIVGVGVTSQYMSIVPVASDGQPTGPCILWMDSRTPGYDNLSHAHTLRAFHRDSYQRAFALVEPMDYLTSRLTGHVLATHSAVFGRVDETKLAPLVPVNSIVGPLHASVADELGIGERVPVIAGTIDSITAAIGSGAIGPTDGSIIIGTTSVIVSHIAEQRTDTQAGIASLPSPIVGMHYLLAENGLGGRAVEWASQLYGYDSVATAITDAETVESAGAQFLPWLNGSLAPRISPDVRAAFVGLELHHDRRHAMRAALEGIVVNVAWLLEPVERFVGGAFPFVRFAGGAAQSPLWAQLLADAIDRPVHRLSDPRVCNARGAAYLAFAALDQLDLAEVPALLRVESIHDPDPDKRDYMRQCLVRLADLHSSLLPTRPSATNSVSKNAARSK